MRIYIASSWKNAGSLPIVAEVLRGWGHEVYLFCEKEIGQHHFNWQDIISPEDDGITCLKYQDSLEGYKCDKWFLDWAEACVLVNPCGRDAHLEGGYIKGKGGKLFILGDFPAGEFSNMYHLADALFRYSELPMMCEVLKCQR